MTLNSLYFIPFLALVLLTVAGLGYAGRKAGRDPRRAQLMALLIFSYVFIFLSDSLFCLITLATSLLTYFAALGMKGKSKRAVLTAAVVALVLELGYFKYTNFFIDSFSTLLGGANARLDIILPLGISFYIFTAIGYLVDVYRGKYEAERDFTRLALMLAFFPKLISGPIVRGGDFLPQLREYKGVSAEGLLTGVQIFVFGLFKKMVLADHLSVFVNDVFGAPSAFNTGTVLLAIISYSLQLYFDFSGYSDMAIGVSKTLGIDIPPNFNLPYVSKSSSGYWSRWHISLSSWLRDYVYIPLGGSRKGLPRTYANLFIIMIICGLWHGAGWTYVLWGALQGLYSIICKALDTHTDKRLFSTGSPWLSLLLVAVNYTVTSLLYIVFRSESLGKAAELLRACFSIRAGISQPFTWSFFAIAVMLAATLAAYLRSRKTHSEAVDGFYPLLDLRKLGGQVLFFVFCALTVIMAYYGDTAFIYGAF